MINEKCVNFEPKKWKIRENRTKNREITDFKP